MSRVKIEDLKPEARELNAKEMKKLFGGLTADISAGYIEMPGSTIQTQEAGIKPLSSTMTKCEMPSPILIKL